MKRFFSLMLLSLFILALLFSLCSCERKPYSRTYHEFLDTVCTVYSYGNESEREFLSRCDKIENRLREYHAIFDAYTPYASDGGTIKDINDAAGREAVTVSGELLDFLAWAKEIYYRTGGALNIAAGKITALWKAADTAAGTEGAHIPSSSELEFYKEAAKIEDIVLDFEASTVFLRSESISLDVGALAKGYVTEKIAEWLIAEGADDYALDFGGNIRVIGDNSGKNYKIGIKNPNTELGGILRLLSLSDAAVVTSGNYERFFIYEGKRYHHIIDMATLMPAEYFASVTIIHESSSVADALSTALFCMSEADGRALAEELCAEVVWIYNDGRVSTTDGALRLLSD